MREGGGYLRERCVVVVCVGGGDTEDSETVFGR